MKESTKPVLVARQELADGIVELINKSELPLFVVQPLIENLAKSIQNAVQRQYEMEKQEYETSLKDNDAKKGE
jgi:hypothetical protein